MTITLEDLTPVELASNANIQAVLSDPRNHGRLVQALSAQKEAGQTDGGVITARHEPLAGEADSTLDIELSMLEASPAPDGSVEIHLDLSSIGLAEIEIGWQVSTGAFMPV